MTVLSDLIENTQAPTQKTPAIEPLLELLHSRYGEAIVAIFLYGSCRTQTDVQDGLIDLCVVVDRYDHAHSNWASRWANAVLPPNVYFAQRAGLKTKYALISQRALEQKLKAKWDQYFWARFCQPLTRLYARSDASARWLVEMQKTALQTFYQHTLALHQSADEAMAFWAAGLTKTYACELRPEPVGHAVRLIEKNHHYWLKAFEALRDEQLPDLGSQWSLRQRWRIRPLTGKLLNMLRLIKAASTVSQGIDYIAWKVARHSGVHMDIQDWMRRHPRIGGLSLAWRVFRRGGFR